MGRWSFNSYCCLSVLILVSPCEGESLPNNHIHFNISLKVHYHPNLGGGLISGTLVKRDSTINVWMTATYYLGLRQISKIYGKT